jgi:hypothetical protein
VISNFTLSTHPPLRRVDACSLIKRFLDKAEGALAVDALTAMSLGAQKKPHESHPRASPSHARLRSRRANSIRAGPARVSQQDSEKWGQDGPGLTPAPQLIPFASVWRRRMSYCLSLPSIQVTINNYFFFVAGRADPHDGRNCTVFWPGE